MNGVLTRTLVLTFGVLALGSCASEVDKNIEEARFLLDQGLYSEAAAAAQLAVTADPTNFDAVFLLATAELAQGFLGTNRTYLDLIADLQDEQATGGSELQSFTAISPATSNETSFALLESARDRLIDDIPDAQKTVNVYTQLYFARLFEISIAVTRIGAQSADEICNANPASAFKDGIPDLFAPGALTSAQAARFEDNLDNVNLDAQRANLPSDFELTGRVVELASDLAAAIAAAGDDRDTGTTNFFNDQFGNTGDASICVLPK